MAEKRIVHVHYDLHVAPSISSDKPKKRHGTIWAMGNKFFQEESGEAQVLTKLSHCVSLGQVAPFWVFLALEEVLHLHEI